MSGVGMRLNSRTDPVTQKWSGAAYGFSGQLLLLSRVMIAGGYWQGNLKGVGTADRDIVEGFALVGARPAGWLSVCVGPHAWTYVSSAGNQRWFLWEGRARVQGEILPGVQSYFQFWKVLSANVNVPQAFQSGAGGEGGLSLRVRDVPIFPDRLPVRIGVAYGIERVMMNSTQTQGARSEVLDRLSLSLGVEGP